METQPVPPQKTWGIRRRHLLQAGLAASASLSAWPLHRPSLLWGAEAGQPKHGGLLRVWGFDPPHFDPHLTINVKTHTTLSFVYSTLVRHKVGPGIAPGTFMVEPHLAERWEAPDDMTDMFHLRHGVKWHNKPPVNGRELVAEDVKFTFDRFLTERGNADRYALESVARVEVVDRYTVKFLLKEPYVWLVDVLANPRSMWIIAPEVVRHFGDLKKPEAAIGTGPFLLERYEPNVKTVFKRNPDYFLPGQPWVDGVEWLVVDDPSTALAMYRTGQLDCGPAPWWSVRQEHVDSLKKTHPHLMYQDFLSTVTHAIFMRTDMAPFNDVRVRRAISQAIDRQAIIEAAWIRGEPTPAISRGLPEWSPRIDELGAGARYYQYDPKEARRLLAEAGFPKGFKTQLHTTGGGPAGPTLIDAVQLVQRALKEVGIEAELKIQEYGAYAATTALGKFEGMAMGGLSISWEPDSVLYGLYAPDQLRNNGHVNDPKITAMLKEQRR
jgi:peptide/nickel transport system substrate-binding protein